MEKSNKALTNAKGEQLPVLSKEATKKLYDLIYSFYGENRTDVKSENDCRWRMLTAAMCCTDTPPFQREGFVLDTQRSIQVNEVLFELSLELGIE